MRRFGLLHPDGHVDGLAPLDENGPRNGPLRAEFARVAPLVGCAVVECEVDPALLRREFAPYAVDGRGRLISHPTLHPARLQEERRRRLVALHEQRAAIERAALAEGGDWTAELAAVDAEINKARGEA